jgi:signal transduction histidine kinase
LRITSSKYVSAGAKPEKGGTGLGLSVCNRIITAHGGKITVESTLQSGTTFFIHLPLMEGQNQ